jgi:hypothetical protein
VTPGERSDAGIIEFVQRGADMNLSRRRHRCRDGAELYAAMREAGVLAKMARRCGTYARIGGGHAQPG